jgi:hypothetical protein
MRKIPHTPPILPLLFIKSGCSSAVMTQTTVYFSSLFASPLSTVVGYREKIVVVALNIFPMCAYVQNSFSTSDI